MYIDSSYLVPIIAIGAMILFLIIVSVRDSAFKKGKRETRRYYEEKEEREDERKKLERLNKAADIVLGSSKEYDPFRGEYGEDNVSLLARVEAIEELLQ